MLLNELSEFGKWRCNNNNLFIANTNTGKPLDTNPTKLTRFKGLTKTDNLNILEKRLINKESVQQ